MMLLTQLSALEVICLVIIHLMLVQERTTVLQIFKLLSSSYSIDCDYHISGNYRLGDIRHNFADLSLIKQKLNFSPKWKINQGIFEFCKWVKHQKISKIDYEGSLDEMKSKNLFKQ